MGRCPRTRVRFPPPPPKMIHNFIYGPKALSGFGSHRGLPRWTKLKEMVDPQPKEKRNKYVELFCISDENDRMKFEFLLNLEKDGLIQIITRKEYATPKGSYYVYVEYLADKPVIQDS